MTTTRPIVSRDPERHSGDLLFAGTRVPVATLLDHWKDGGTIDEFLVGFPSVERGQVLALLDQLASAPVADALEVMSTCHPDESRPR